MPITDKPVSIPPVLTRRQLQSLRAHCTCSSPTPPLAPTSTRISHHVPRALSCRSTCSSPPPSWGRGPLLVCRKVSFAPRSTRPFSDMSDDFDEEDSDISERACRQLIHFDEEEWVEREQYVKEVVLLKNQSDNPLIMNADELRGPYDFARPFQSLAQCVTLLVVRNANRGLCMHKSFRKGNVEFSKTYNQIRLKKPGMCELDEDLEDKSRAASFRAARSFLIDTLIEYAGTPRIMNRLSSGADDFLVKMLDAVDERAIVMNTSLLPLEGQASLIIKLNRLIKEGIFCSNSQFQGAAQSVANAVISSLPGTRWEYIAQKNKLLHFIYMFAEREKQAAAAAAAAAGQPHLGQGHQTGPAAGQPMMRHGMQKQHPTGVKFVGHCRNVILHGPEKAARDCLSYIDYSFDDVVQLVTASYPDVLQYSVEVFLVEGLWDELGISQFFSKRF